MKNLKRFLSMVLALVLTLSCVPAQVLAADSPNDEKLQTGGQNPVNGPTTAPNGFGMGWAWIACDTVVEIPFKGPTVTQEDVNNRVAASVNQLFAPTTAECDSQSLAKSSFVVYPDGLPDYKFVYMSGTLDGHALGDADKIMHKRKQEATYTNIDSANTSFKTYADGVFAYFLDRVKVCRNEDSANTLNEAKIDALITDDSQWYWKSKEIGENLALLASPMAVRDGISADPSYRMCPLNIAMSWVNSPAPADSKFEQEQVQWLRMYYLWVNIAAASGKLDAGGSLSGIYKSALENFLKGRARPVLRVMVQPLGTMGKDGPITDDNQVGAQTSLSILYSGKGLTSITTLGPTADRTLEMAQTVSICGAMTALWGQQDGSNKCGGPRFYSNPFRCIPGYAITGNNWKLATILCKYADNWELATVKDGTLNVQGAKYYMSSGYLLLMDESTVNPPTIQPQIVVSGTVNNPTSVMGEPTYRAGVSVNTPAVNVTGTSYDLTLEVNWELDLDYKEYHVEMTDSGACVIKEGSGETLITSLNNVVIPALNGISQQEKDRYAAFEASVNKLEGAGPWEGKLSKYFDTKLREDCGTLDFRLFPLLSTDVVLDTDRAANAVEASDGYFEDGVKPSATLQNMSGSWDPSSDADYKALKESGNKLWATDQVCAGLQQQLSGVADVHIDGDSVAVVVSPNKLQEFLQLVGKSGNKLSVTTTHQLHGSIQPGQQKQVAAFMGASTRIINPPKMMSASEDYTWERKEGDIVVDTVHLKYSGQFPVEPESGSEGSEIRVRCFQYAKVAPVSVTGLKVDQPSFHSSVNPNPHAEINQGTVSTAGGQVGVFNSTTGTPTVTSGDLKTSLNPPYYSKDTGKYYQYFGAGGSEFVVEFDGKFHDDGTATREFEFNFTESTCDLNKTGPAHSHSSHGDPACNYCHGNGESSGAHQACGSHLVTTQQLKFSIEYTNLCYVSIENLKVWQLSAARVDGTRELLPTDAVTATVQSTAPDFSYHIADPNSTNVCNGASGRVVYEAFPAGAEGSGAAGTIDKLVWNLNTSTKCTSYATENMNAVKSILEGKNDGAWCVSDYIVLHTSAGDQSIMYYEYKTPESKPILSSIETTSPCSPNQGPSDAKDTAIITLTQTRDKCAFDKKSKVDLWDSNLSSAASYVDDGITYGGYNGNFKSPDTKYVSSKTNPVNITWSSTQAYKNQSKVYGTQTNSHLFQGNVSPVFRLVADGLTIPDNRTNGLYSDMRNQDTGFPARVFYKSVVDYQRKETGPWKSSYTSQKQKDFGDDVSGFTLPAGYGTGSVYDNAHTNSVVVYNPLSNENAIVLKLPDSRDQRVTKHDPGEPYIPYLCPGENCEFSTLLPGHDTDNHLHTSACYRVFESTTGPAYNVHVHNDACGKINDKGNTVVEGHYSYEAAGTFIYTTTARKDGYVTYYSHGYTADPIGALWVNGVRVEHDDDSGPGKWDFYISEGVKAGDELKFQVYQYEDSGAGEVDVVIELPGSLCNNLPLNFYDEHKVLVKDPGGQSTAYTVDQGEGQYLLQNVGGGCAYRGEYHLSTDRNTCTGCDHPTCVHSFIGEVDAGAGSRTVRNVMMVCEDPHHTWDSYWHVYTTGMLHTDGAECKGDLCTNASAVKFPFGEEYTPAELAGGSIVLHTDGKAHLTVNTSGRCDYCKRSYSRVLFGATSLKRVLTESDIAKECEHYALGDARCWKPCGDSSNHRQYKTQIKLKNDEVLEPGAFINLDYGFQLYYPNTGNFYGTGATWKGRASAERGKGYIDNMDTVDWVARKWVVFPFDVIYQGKTYKASERVDLEVRKEYFDFYLPLENSEAGSATVTFGATAINDPTNNVVDEARKGESKNTRIISNARILSHPHDVDKPYAVDVVGRIGALTTNDVGDFRYSNFFKTVTSEWLVPNVLYKVDSSKQYNILTDMYDVRGIQLDETFFHDASSTLTTGQEDCIKPTATDSKVPYHTNTYTNWVVGRERAEAGRVRFPLTPQLLKNQTYTKQNPLQKASSKQPMRVGYQAYMDFTTLGNYYGYSSDNWCEVRPHYYRMPLSGDDAGKLYPLDVWMQKGNGYAKINSAYGDMFYGAGIPVDECVSLNWMEESLRRNYSATEKAHTDFIYNQMQEEKAAATAPVEGTPMNGELKQDVESKQVVWDRPRGSNYLYGTYDILTLRTRNRTCIGATTTYGVDTNPADRLPASQYYMNAGRWHFNVGLPSSAVFVPAGTEEKDVDAASKALRTNANVSQWVVVVALEIHAHGDVWDLAYDGFNVNSQQINVAGVEVKNEHPTYPVPTGGEPIMSYLNPGSVMEMPIVAVMSINHSSKEDVNVAGTH